jgi:hypothetical protein
MNEPSIYLRCSSGFGNKVFDLISAIYLKKKYNLPVYFAVDKSIHDSPNDPFFGAVFNKSHQYVKYIFMPKYYHLEKTLPITAIWIGQFSDLPDKITGPIRPAGMYKYAYKMYSTFNDTEKKIFELNKKFISKSVLNKIDHACVHIRYGDKLCFSDEDYVSSKYTHYMFPLYSPQFYIEMINKLLHTSVNEIIVMTDSVNVVDKYIMKEFIGNPKIKLIESNYLDSFYLLTKAKYIVMSHSTFSFAAAILNNSVTCFMLKKYMEDPIKDTIAEDGAISPDWIIYDRKDELLNYNQKLLKEMVKFYDNCNKYIGPKK